MGSPCRNLQVLKLTGVAFRKFGLHLSDRRLISRLIDLPGNRNIDRIRIPQARRKSDIFPEEIARGAGGPMAGVMVTLSVNRTMGAIAPQILNPCAKIDQKVYAESLQGHISPSYRDRIRSRIRKEKRIW